MHGQLWKSCTSLRRDVTQVCGKENQRECAKPQRAGGAGREHRAGMSLENVLAAAGLTHLTDKLGSETLESCVAAFTEKGRAGYMTHLKASGVEKLSDRQKFATSVGKVAKDGVVAAAPTALDKAAARWTNVELAKEMEGTQLTVRPKELARLLAGALPGLGPSPTLPGEAPSAPKPEARMRLIVLYGTGHKASDLAAWQAASPPWLEIRVLELPGHGTRAAEGVWSVGTLRMDEAALSDEEICSSVESERTRLVDALADSVRPLLDSPYCLYGFSSGALLAYLVVLELQKRGWPMPFRLFAGGRGAPHCVWSPEVIRQYRTPPPDSPPRFALPTCRRGRLRNAPPHPFQALLLLPSRARSTALAIARHGEGVVHGAAACARARTHTHTPAS